MQLGRRIESNYIASQEVDCSASASVLRQFHTRETGCNGCGANLDVIGSSVVDSARSHNLVDLTINESPRIMWAFRERSWIHTSIRYCKIMEFTQTTILQTSNQSHCPVWFVLCILDYSYWCMPIPCNAINTLELHLLFKMPKATVSTPQPLSFDIMT